MNSNTAIKENPIYKTYETEVVSQSKVEGSMKIRSDSSPLVKRMNSLLADEYALFTKTLNYHWNVTGPRFYSMHEFLEGQYKELLTMIDNVAERIRKIGSKPMGTLSEFSDRSSIVERPGIYPETSLMISDLLEGHKKVQDEIREMIDQADKFAVDPGTEDFLTGLLKQHEEMAWMLKSTLN